MTISIRSASLAAVLALGSLGAHADEADASQFVSDFQTSRTRAEVAAEASAVPKNRNLEPAGSRVVTYKSIADRDVVKAQAAEVVRARRTASGEVNPL